MLYILTSYTGKYAHCASCKYPFLSNLCQHNSKQKTQEQRRYERRERADSNTGNNIFEPKESPDMKEGNEGEKDESK
jgi:hypothetical protein